MRWFFTRKSTLDTIAADMASYGLEDREGTQQEHLYLKTFFGTQKRRSVISTINEHLDNHPGQNFCGDCGWIDGDCEHMPS
jgi:hypothetical protein